MLSKSSKILNKRHNNLGLQTPHSRSKEKVAPNHRKNGIERIENLKKTSPNYKQRRTMGRQRKTLENGASSIGAPGIT
jgi:hypothetical protein